jgi:ABC-type dipeptide/oligopeptide/nickel transport system permease subunit
MFDARARARFRKNRGALVGAGLVALLVAFALIGPAIAGHDPNTSDFEGAVGAGDMPVGPSPGFLLGADRLFRDMFSRLAHGARLSLLIGVAATAIASTIGAFVGVLAGWTEGSRGLRLPWIALGSFAGAFCAWIHADAPIFACALALFGLLSWGPAIFFEDGPWSAGIDLNLDTVLMRFVDVGLSFPFLLLVMAVGAALDRTNVTTILVTLGLTSWLGTARVVRAKTLQVRSHDFVVAARALGQSTARILTRHVLPNVAGPLIVLATISVAQMIVAESVLSYLGAGIGPPTATWGHMLQEGQDYYLAAPWTLVAPAATILTAVFGFNLLGEGLRDALDPRED